MTKIYALTIYREYVLKPYLVSEMEGDDGEEKPPPDNPGVYKLIYGLRGEDKATFSKTMILEKTGRELILKTKSETISWHEEGEDKHSLNERLKSYLHSFKEFRSDWKWNKTFQALINFFGGFVSGASIDFFTSYMWGTGNLPGHLNPDDVREFSKSLQQLAYALNILSLPLINQIDKWSKRKVYLTGSIFYSMAYFTPLIYIFPFGSPMIKYMVDRTLATISVNLFAPFLTSTVSYHERMQVPQEHVAKNLSLTRSLCSASAVLGISFYNLVRGLSFPYFSSILGIFNANLLLFLIGSIGIFLSYVIRGKIFIYRETITLEELSDIVREILEEKFGIKIKRIRINFISLKEFSEKYGVEKILKAQKNSRSLVHNLDFNSNGKIEASILLKRIDDRFDEPQYSDVARGIAEIIGGIIFKEFKAYKVLANLDNGRYDRDFYMEIYQILREMYISFINYTRKLVEKEDLTEKLNRYGVDPNFWKQRKFLNRRGIIKPAYILSILEIENNGGKFEDMLNELEDVDPRKVYEAFKEVLNIDEDELYKIYRSGRLYSLIDHLRDKITE